ncbi:MAG: MBL fold metallo-hydrolase [Bacilli bacterium]|nr:MBL fold metallo-hydrolase [Bacilli bacterium]
MRVCVLASGSKGNSTIIETDTHKILIDVGITCKDLEKRLNEIGINILDIDTLLITHSHSDHVKGLMTFYKKVKPTIYMSDKTYNELDILDLDYISITPDFNIDDIDITTISMSHDVDCHGYIIEYQGKSIVYITDTGYINEKYYEVLKDRTIYIFESNHDIEMNFHSKKPEKYRKRVIGDKGHLSNNQASYYLSRLVGDKTKYIVLAHLSEDDNKEELALGLLNESLTKNNKKVDNINVAYQREISNIIEV